MRFFEFAPKTKPVINRGVLANTPATPLPTNTPTTPSPAEPIKVYPRAWQHEWVQRYLAAQMAKDAQTIKPTELDLVKAQMIYADVQRKADQDYQASQMPSQLVKTTDSNMSFKRTRR